MFNSSAGSEKEESEGEASEYQKASVGAENDPFYKTIIDYNKKQPEDERIDLYDENGDLRTQAALKKEIRAGVAAAKSMQSAKSKTKANGKATANVKAKAKAKVVAKKKG